MRTPPLLTAVTAALAVAVVALVTQPAHAQLVVLVVAICESLLESCGYIDAHVGSGTAHHPEKVSPPLSALSGRPA